MALGLISIKAKSDVEVSMRVLLRTDHLTSLVVTLITLDISWCTKNLLEILYFPMIFQNLSNLKACVIFTKGA